MRMPRAPRHMPLLPILLGIVVIALVGVVGLGWQRWESIAATSSQHSKDIKQQYALATDTSKDTEKATRQKALATLAGYSEDVSSCQGAWWYGWLADVLPVAKQAADRCAKNTGIVRPVIVQADKLVTYLEEEARLQTIIESLAINSAKKDWQATAQTAVAKAEKELDALKGSTDFKRVSEITRRQLKAISTMWSALSEASKKQDRKAYEAAVDGLDNAYIGLAVVTDTSDDTIAEHLEALALAGKKL